MIISVEDLVRHDACPARVRQFRKLFPKRLYPNGVEITTKLARKYWREFPPSWAARQFLPTGAQQEFEQAYDSLRLTRREQWILFACLSMQVEGHPE